MNSLTNDLINNILDVNAQANPGLEAALENLADVSLGQTPSIWPLAWGWWFVIVVAILALAGISWFVAVYIRKHKFQRKALTAVNNITNNEPQALVSLHAVLRRAVMHYFGTQEISSLQGEAWQHFLQNKAKHTKKINEKSLEQLAQLESSLYTKEPSINVDDAKQAVSLWIKHCLPPAASELSTSSPILTDKQGVQHV